MKKLIKLMPIVMFWAFIATGCVDDNNGTETPSYKKIEQVFTGKDLQNVELSNQYFWNGERLNKVEGYYEGTVSDRVEIDYVTGSNIKIAEIRVWSLPDDGKSSNYIIRELRRIVTFGKEKEDNLVLETKIVPVYVDNKVTRLNIFAEGIDFAKEFINIGYIKIDYTGNYPNKMSMYILTSAIPDFPQIPGVEEIEVSQNYIIWQNGNITTQYSKSLYFTEDNSMDFMTSDSAVYAYDNKLNAYSSIKNISPMFEAETSSKNNITSFDRYIFIDTGEGIYTMNFTATVSYQYDAGNYPTVATATINLESVEETSCAKYEYK